MKSIAGALDATYELISTRIQRETEYASELENEVIAPMQALLDKMVGDLDMILKGVQSEVKDLKECGELVNAARLALVGCE